MLFRSQTRLPILPDVPPFGEVSNTPDFEAVSWHMLLAPSGTPKPVVDLLHAEMKAATNDPEFTKKIAEIGLIPFATPDIEGQRAYLPGYPQGRPGEVAVRYLGIETLKPKGRDAEPIPVLAWAEIGRTEDLKEIGRAHV